MVQALDEENHTTILKHMIEQAELKDNPKNLQYIMGHSNITITLNLYAHASGVGQIKK